MTNYDVHVFKTRDGKWQCRVSWLQSAVYTRARKDERTALLDVGSFIAWLNDVRDVPQERCPQCGSTRFEEWGKGALVSPAKVSARCCDCGEEWQFLRATAPPAA